MAMVVANNVPALTAYNTVNATSNALSKSIKKLSTGLRINSAADDAAGLAISEKMRAQIKGINKALTNSQDGISMIQTAEGALNETHSILQRMRELSVQAANDTLTQQDRSYIQLEIDQLKEQVTNIGNTTQFNGKSLLNGDAAVMWSSSDLNTKAIINGGLRQVDQFGQKASAEGNYKISIKSKAGTAEAQKSDIFTIKHKDVVYNKSVNPDAGLDDVSIDNIPAGDYTITNTAAATADKKAAVVSGQYGLQDISMSTSGALRVGENAGGDGPDPANEITDSAHAAAGDGVMTFTFGLKGFKGNDGTNTKGMIDLDLKNAGEDPLTADDFAKAIVKVLDGQTMDDNETKLSAKYADGLFTLTALNKDGTATDLSTGAALMKINSSYVADGDTDPTAGTIDVAEIFTGVEDEPALQAAEPDTLKGDVTTAITTEIAGNKLAANANVLFEVTDVNDDARTVTLKATASLMKADGSTEMKSMENIVLNADGKTPWTDTEDKLGLGAGALSMTMDSNYNLVFSKGDKFVLNVGLGTEGGADTSITVSGKQDKDWAQGWQSFNDGVTDNATNYGVKSSSVAGKDLSIKNFYLNEKTGEVTEGTIKLALNDKFNAPAADVTETMGTFSAAYVGKTAQGDVKLRDLNKFWDSQGVFMLQDPQTITITQGDGKQASVTLYATDTLDDVATKLNDAIATGLGQAQYLVDKGADQFVNFVSKPEAKAGTSESVEGTFVIRSIVPGADGRISFSGAEDIINAFSLNQIQADSESVYTVSVEDAHSGSVIASDVQITGNRLIGVVNPNVDVSFDAMNGIKANWDADRRAFTYEANTPASETILHLSDNTTVFQIGANEGEDMAINIGDMRSEALGLNKVLVTDRGSAARSITIIDNAIDKVSTQRAKLGAYQNRLEYTMNTLTTTAENLTSAESGIRDTDMASEMMNFTKLQIMLQAGTSMLAQANQLPQNVLSLVR